MFRSRIPRIAQQVQFLKNSRRSLHHVPRLINEDKFASQGINNFLTAPAFQLAWTDYQSYLIERLNAVLAGTEDAHKDVKQTLLRYAREPHFASHFNYASMAWNNHFFFKCLSPTEVAMPSELEIELKASFGSIETLKRELIITARSMFGPGFVWLVKDGAKYSVLCTYLAGTPFAEGHYRRQGVDMNTEDKAIGESMMRLHRQPVVNTVGAHGPQSELPRASPGASIVTPILCLNTWEHVYLQDYGFGNNGVGGKKLYAENWWKRIDWAEVANNAGLNTSKTMYN